ncbi:N-acetylglucosamine repressor [compost metagenome]
MAAAEAGDERAVELFRSIGSYLGAGIANIVNVFNPDVVIIGNRISHASRWLEAAVQEAVDQRTLPYHRERMRILFAELQDRSAVRGAAYYAINTFLGKVRNVG